MDEQQLATELKEIADRLLALAETLQGGQPQTPPPNRGTSAERDC